MTTMNKKQIKNFKKLTKGTKETPTTVLITWNVWHSLPYKVQNSKLRTIIVISKNADWSENCWTHPSVDSAFVFHDIMKHVIIVGDHKFNNEILKTLKSKKCNATVIDVELDVEYEFII